MVTKFHPTYKFLVIILLGIGCNKHQPQNVPVDCLNIPPLSGTGTGYQIVSQDTVDKGAVYNPSNNNEIIYLKLVNHLNAVKLFKAVLNSGDSFSISFGNSFISVPQWSANDWIVFGNDDFQIYKYKSDGSGLTQLTSAGLNYNPAWSPDGKMIVFKKGPLLYTMNSDGTRLKQLDSLAGSDNPALSPDGKKIAYFVSGDAYIGYIDTTTRQKTILANTNARGGVISGLSWFPGSDWIIYSDGTGVYKINITTKQEVKLRSCCNSRSYAFPSVSSDGTNFLISRLDTKVVGIDTAYSTYRVYKINTDGTNEQKVDLR